MASEIICQNNEYVSQLLKTDNVISLNCKQIPTENKQIQSKRIEFFKTPIFIIAMILLLKLFMIFHQKILMKDL